MPVSIHQLLKKQEGKTLEFKRDLSSPEKIMRTLVAFFDKEAINVPKETPQVPGAESGAESKIVEILNDLSSFLVSGLFFLL